MSRSRTVQEPATLLPFLFANWPDEKKKQVRTWLKFQAVTVNDRAISQFDHPLKRGDVVRVMVYDNGPGLPRGREEAIFEKFTRGEKESAKPGVGLGLAICRAIVEAHGGTIAADKSPLGGAAIVFTLPVGTPPQAPEIEES